MYSNRKIACNKGCIVYIEKENVSLYLVDVFRNSVVYIFILKKVFSFKCND